MFSFLKSVPSYDEVELFEVHYHPEKRFPFRSSNRIETDVEFFHKNRFNGDKLKTTEREQFARIGDVKNKTRIRIHNKKVLKSRNENKYFVDDFESGIKEINVKYAM